MIHDYDVPTADTPWGRLDTTLGDRVRAKVGNNTYARRLTPGNFGPIAVRLHETDVVIAYVDGSVRLDSGGWRTVTTKDRVNRFLPGFTMPDGTRVHAGLGASQGTWSVGRWWSKDAPTPENPYGMERGGEEVSVYYDGMVLDARGAMVTEPLTLAGDPDKAVKRAIGKYVALYTDEKIAELLAHAIANGTAGDCWFCGMRTTGGAPLGDVSGDTEHLTEHMQEGYTMATLLRNAIEARGYRDPAVILHYSPDLARKALRRYLTQRLAANTTGATPTGENYSATHAYYR